MLRQEKISAKFSLALRLERLRSNTGKTWDQIATDLGIKKAMVHHVLAARRGFSEKTIQRLIECEVAAGLRSRSSVLIERGLRGGDLVATLLRGVEYAQSKVTINDIDQGSKQVPLEYRRGSPPAGFPKSINVTAAKNTEVWSMLGEESASGDPANFLKACLPEDIVRKQDVLESITPACFAGLLQTALELTFGLNWRKNKTGESEK